MKNTLIVNLIGGPGAGKTTTMAGIFHKLKCLDIDAEMVSEFAKELVYENRKDTMKDELYIFAKQAHRLFCVNGKVDVIVTDRPLFLTVAFNHMYNYNSPELDALCLKKFNEYDNYNFFINRKHNYQENGRNEDEELANKIAYNLKKIADENNIEYENVDSGDELSGYIVERILEKLKERE